MNPTSAGRAIGVLGLEEPKLLAPEAQAFNQGLVAALRFTLEVIQHPPTLANHHQKPTARMVIFRMGFEMVCKILNAFTENGHLDFW